ncbi:MAG: hypothetical protein F6K18_30195 [Okeania sp. SIO2C2]|uniref:hypothetical protein n=1 Tax=Okeania sp. SIO2C2 TaxID=2607787 RepID=UPI0013BCF48F|nr:hypothetical protein [Okeania sp. SIO2C2]NEP90740.1 hypothetical protein [Okeania sp. SIO2C2]
MGNYLDPKQDSDPDTETVTEPESKNKSKISMSKTPEMKAWEKDLQDLLQEKYTNEVNCDTTADSSTIPKVFQSDGGVPPGR